MNKWTKYGILAATFLVVSGLTFRGVQHLQETAFAKGMNAAVSVCYQMPGVWANNETGETIICGPLSTIPPEEMEELNKNRT